MLQPSSLSILSLKIVKVKKQFSSFASRLLCILHSHRRYPLQGIKVFLPYRRVLLVFFCLSGTLMTAWYHSDLGQWS